MWTTYFWFFDSLINFNIFGFFMTLRNDFLNEKDLIVAPNGSLILVDFYLRQFLSKNPNCWTIAFRSLSYNHRIYLAWQRWGWGLLITRLFVQISTAELHVWENEHTGYPICYLYLIFFMYLHFRETSRYPIITLLSRLIIFV